VATPIRLSAHSDIPIYRQIVTQLTFMIEMGHLRDGDRLPSSRLLADNLQINRNTVAHAYSVLRDRAIVESRGRGGMVVVGAATARETSDARDRARAVLEAAAQKCVDLGLTPTEIQGLMADFTGRATESAIRVSFVECNRDRADYFAGELQYHLGLPVRPLVLGEFDPEAEHPDLVLTTFFHLAEVRGLLRRPSTDVVALVVGPHIQTLVEIARVPKGRTVGILYSTDDQAAGIRDSLTQSGIGNITVLAGTTQADLHGVDLVVVPSEMPELKAALHGRVRVIEFGNVLDAASLRMVDDVVRDLRVARNPATGRAAD
jgi:DNA-binding transcriptional regulator YhcF (GntR family)